MTVALQDASAEALLAMNRARMPVYLLFLCVGCGLMALMLRQSGRPAEKTHKRNGMIEALRVLFAIGIIMHHSVLELNRSAFLGVEFYFLVSGWFLMARFEKETARNRISAGRFLKDRLCRLGPWQLLRWLVGLGLCAAAQSGASLLQNAARSMGDLLFLRCAGIANDTGVMDLSGWYMSALMLASMTVYLLLMAERERFLKLFMPLLVAAAAGYAVCTAGNLDLTVEAGPLGLMTSGYWRALAELGLGCGLYAVSDRRGETFGFSARGRAWASVGELGAVVFLFFWMLTRRKGMADIVFLVPLSLLMVSVLRSDSHLTAWISRCPAVFRLGRLVLPVYLLHNLVRDRLVCPLLPDMEQLPAAIVTTAVSFVLAALLEPVVSRMSGILPADRTAKKRMIGR